MRRPSQLFLLVCRMMKELFPNERTPDQAIDLQLEEQQMTANGKIQTNIEVVRSLRKLALQKIVS